MLQSPERARLFRAFVQLNLARGLTAIMYCPQATDLRSCKQLTCCRRNLFTANLVAEVLI